MSHVQAFRSADGATPIYIPANAIHAVEPPLELEQYRLEAGGKRTLVAKIPGRGMYRLEYGPRHRIAYATRETLAAARLPC